METEWEYGWAATFTVSGEPYDESSVGYTREEAEAYIGLEQAGEDRTYPMSDDGHLTYRLTKRRKASAWEPVEP